MLVIYKHWLFIIGFFFILISTSAEACSEFQKTTSPLQVNGINLTPGVFSTINRGFGDFSDCEAIEVFPNSPIESQATIITLHTERGCPCCGTISVPTVSITDNIITFTSQTVPPSDTGVACIQVVVSLDRHIALNLSRGHYTVNWDIDGNRFASSMFDVTGIAAIPTLSNTSFFILIFLLIAITVFYRKEHRIKPKK